MNEDRIRNIYCVGRNYRLHAAELGNDVPDEPMIFMKPTHALVPMKGQTLHVPYLPGELHYEAELVLHIGKPYERGIRVEELVDRIALGIDFTLRDVQTVLKKKGHPWLPAKGFLQSAPITDFHPAPGPAALQAACFSLELDGKEVQRGAVSDMLFDLQQLVDYCAKHYGLGTGDIVYTGTPAGVGAVSDGGHLRLKWGEEAWGDCTVRYNGDNRQRGDA